MSKLWRTHTTVILIAGLMLLTLASGVLFMLNNFKPTTELTLGSGSFNARVADTDETRVKGLSGVTSMGPNDALLFVFDQEKEWGIWMKDMVIPIDIVWLDAQKEVVYIVTDADPKLGTLKTYTPKDPSKYVIEFAAGTVGQYGITVGSRADFVVSGGGNQE